jgi:hypothetical protein
VEHERTDTRLHIGEVEVFVVVETRGPDHAAEVAAALANELARQVIATRNSLAVEDAPGSDGGPAVIEQARPATAADPTGAIPAAALGGFLGLLAGLMAAAGWELVRPTLTSPREVSATFGAPHVGDVPPVSPLLGAVIVRTADEASVSSLRVLTIGDSAYLGAVVDDLAKVLPDTVAVQPPPSNLDAISPAPDELAGVLILAPRSMPQHRAEPVRVAVAQLGEPVLGVVTYHPRALRSRPSP